MKLRDLVDEALKVSPEFVEKWDYWIMNRRRPPTLEWLMPLLEKALGEDFVRKAARGEMLKNEFQEKHSFWHN